MIGTMSSPSSFEGGGGPSSRKMEKERRRGTRWSELISRDSAPWYSANPYFPPIHREWRKSSLVSRVQGGKSIPRTFVMPVILPVPAAAASSFFTRGARDSFWLPAVSGIGCPEKGRDSVKRARAIGKRTRGLFTGQDER